MARAFAWLMILAGLIGILFMKAIHEKLLGGHVPVLVVLPVLAAGPAIGFLILGGLEKGLRPAALLPRLRINGHLVAALVLAGAAIVLWIIGSRLREPPMEAYGLASRPERTVGHTEPPIFVPGVTIQLTIDEGGESILGLWRCTKLEVEPVPSPDEWSLTGLTTMPEEETWDLSQDYLTGPGVPSTYSSENVPFAPWIRFTVPNNWKLKGTTLQVHVRMHLLYPDFLGGHRFINRSHTVDRTVAFDVASHEEVADFVQWRLSCRRCRSLNKMRKLAILACVLLSTALLANGGLKAR